MPPKMMRVFITALPRMTEESPTALAISPSQVSQVMCVFGDILSINTLKKQVYLEFSVPELYLRFSFLEATIITEPPEDTEVKVGDEVILSCSASFDPMLDIAFIWAVDFRVIDFDSEWQHYERVLVG